MILHHNLTNYDDWKIVGTCAAVVTVAQNQNRWIKKRNFKCQRKYLTKILKRNKLSFHAFLIIVLQYNQPQSGYENLCREKTVDIDSPKLYQRHLAIFLDNIMRLHPLITWIEFLVFFFVSKERTWVRAGLLCRVIISNANRRQRKSSGRPAGLTLVAEASNQWAAAASIQSVAPLRAPSEADRIAKVPSLAVEGRWQTALGKSNRRWSADESADESAVGSAGASAVGSAVAAVAPRRSRRRYGCRSCCMSTRPKNHAIVKEPIRMRRSFQSLA